MITIINQAYLMKPEDSNQIAEQLEFLHRTLMRAIKTGVGRLRSRAAEGCITVPQQLLVLELTREDGLSLKTLSGRMGLSHSTVSGIVDRLELKKIVRRETDAADRRISRIYLSERVKHFVKTAKAGIYAPLVAKIESAAGKEQARIMDGLASLCAALEREE